MRGTLRMPKAMVTQSNLAVGIGQFLGVALLEAHVAQAKLGGALAAYYEHVGVDVADRRPRALTARRDHAEGNISSPASHIEQGEGLVALRRIDRRHQRILPGAVHAAGHQVVHQVVAPRDRAEHVVHQPLLVGKRHRLFAEMGLVAGFRHDTYFGQ